jgi:AraC-like DNA-binding protein
MIDSAFSTAFKRGMAVMPRQYANAIRLTCSSNLHRNNEKNIAASLDASMVFWWFAMPF